MRDVNRNYSNAEGKITKRFYLNYEGCKHNFNDFYARAERLVKNFVFPIYNVNCKVGLCC